MSEDVHIRCNVKITYKSVLRDNANNPLLQKLWDDANVWLSIPDGPDFYHEHYYEDVKDLFPKVRSEFILHYTRFYDDLSCFPEDHERVYRTLKWFAEYLRQLVKRTGEVWYTENWVSDEKLTKENIKVITYDVNKELCFMKHDDKGFTFGEKAFYRFIDSEMDDAKYPLEPVEEEIPDEMPYTEICIRCNEKITYESVRRDNENNPLLQKLWDDANIRLLLPDEPCSDDMDYGEIRKMFPKVRTDFHLGCTEFNRAFCRPQDRECIYLTLKWFAEYLRQLVKRTGEVWYFEHWPFYDEINKENLKIATFDVNKEICFMKPEDEEFAFDGNTFYRFVDGDEQN